MEKYYILRRNKNKIEFAESYGKKLENNFSLDLYIEHHKDGKWKITEASSGLLIYQGKTKEKTIDDCFIKLAETGVENIKALIKSCIAKHGISPLYAQVSA